MSASYSLEEQWLAVVSGEARGPLPALARTLLTGVSAAYRLGLKANLGLYEWRLKARSQTALPVISVGNLSLGGTGKTTVVRYLATQLLNAGLRPGIVLRGHGGQTRDCCLANDGQGQVLSSTLSGDEAAEYARLLPQIPVVIGKRREASISLLASVGVQVALLDDGFQYFRMAREVDIVLVSARRQKQLEHLFPRGVLREPWEHLRRANQVWITHADQVTTENQQELSAFLSCHAPQAPIAMTYHRPAALVELLSGAIQPLKCLLGQRVVAVSALGSPLSFEQSLQALGCLVIPLRFPDHHRYTEADWQKAETMAREHVATGIVTTWKDAVKLNFPPPQNTWVLRSEIQFLSGEEQVTAMIEMLMQRISGG